MNKVWPVQCDGCGDWVYLKYPPRDEIYWCVDCENGHFDEGTCYETK